MLHCQGTEKTSAWEGVTQADPRLQRVNLFFLCFWWRQYMYVVLVFESLCVCVHACVDAFVAQAATKIQSLARGRTSRRLSRQR